MITFSISDEQNIGITSADLSVSVQGNPCVVDTTTPLTAVTCQLPINTDNSSVLVAGKASPQIYIKSAIGFVDYDVGINPLNIPLVVTSAANTAGGINGGYVATINGKGFPSDANKITITVCNKTATIQSINNIQIKFYVPSCDQNGTQPINIVMGTLTDSSQTVTYGNYTTVPIISSLFPTSANPGSKGTLKITGSNFGNGSTPVRVFLTNSSGKVYELNVISLIDT